MISIISLLHDITFIIYQLQPTNTSSIVEQKMIVKFVVDPNLLHYT